MPPLSPLDLAILALSTFAIAYYVSSTDGPWAVFYHLRLRVGAEWDPDDVATLGDEAIDTDPLSEPPSPGSLAQLFSCPYCLSPYAAALSIDLWFYLYPLALILALTGASAFLLRLTD